MDSNLNMPNAVHSLKMYFPIYSHSLAVSHVICFLKPLKILNIKISSTSLVHAHYMFRTRLVISCVPKIVD
jgi:hypothetical protein